MAIPVSYPSNHIEENVRRVLLGKKQIRLSAEGDDFDDWQRFRARLDRLRDEFVRAVYKPDHNRIDLFVDWHGKSFATVLTGNLYDGDEGFYRFLGKGEFITAMPGSKKTVEITAWVFKESIELLVSKKKTL